MTLNTISSGTKPKKIDHYKLGERVTQMIFGQGLGDSKVAEILQSEGYDIDSQIVRLYRLSVINMVPDFLLKNEKYKETIAKIFLDTTENLVYAIGEIKTKIDEWKATENWKAHATYVGLMLEQLRLLSQRAGEIKVVSQKILNQQINIFEVNQAIHMVLADFVKDGEIDIEKGTISENLKKRLKEMMRA